MERKLGDYGEDGTGSYGIGAHPTTNLNYYRSQDGFGRTNRAVNVKLENIYINAWRAHSTSAYNSSTAATTSCLCPSYWPGPNGTFDAKNIYCRMRDPSFNTPTALPLADRAGGLVVSNLLDPLSVKFENIIVDYRGSTLSDPASFPPILPGSLLVGQVNI